jgi:hypothetical protein
MARALYKKQEKLLDKYKYVSKVDDLPLAVWDELKTIYDWECLYSHADCYLRDNFCYDTWEKRKKGYDYE